MGHLSKWMELTCTIDLFKEQVTAFTLAQHYHFRALKYRRPETCTVEFEAKLSLTES